MAFTKTNVIVGAARFFVAEQKTGAGAAIVPPVAVAATPYVTTVLAATDWREVGFTQEGVEVSYEPDYGDVEVDQYLDSARVFKTGQRVSVNTTLAEATLDNLLLTWGQRTSTKNVPSTVPDTTTGELATLTIASGSLGDAPIERQLIFVGNGPENTANGFYNERTYTIQRALSVESSAHALRRNEATVFPVSFRLLPNDAVAGAPYGTVRDREHKTTWVMP